MGMQSLWDGKMYLNKQQQQLQQNPQQQNPTQNLTSTTVRDHVVF